MNDVNSLTDDMIRAAFQARSALASPGGLASTIAAATARTSQRRGWQIALPHAWQPEMRWGRVFAGAVAAVFIVGIGTAYLLGSVPNVGGPPSPSVSPTPSPSATPAADTERLSGIQSLVDAVNRADTERFQSTFAAGASFTTAGHFHVNQPLFPEIVAVAKSDQVEAWLGVLQTWGLDAEVRSCHPVLAADAYRMHDLADPIYIECEVAARWRTLSLEVVESWQFEFDDQKLMHWRREALVLDPVERELPMGYRGLEEWEGWLGATRPVSAERLLNERDYDIDCGLDWTTVTPPCAEGMQSLAPGDPERGFRLARVRGTTDHSWFINGLEFSPTGFIPYDPANADEIEASILAFLAAR